MKTNQTTRRTEEMTTKNDILKEKISELGRIACKKCNYSEYCGSEDMLKICDDNLEMELRETFPITYENLDKMRSTSIVGNAASDRGLLDLCNSIILDEDSTEDMKIEALIKIDDVMGTTSVLNFHGKTVGVEDIKDYYENAGLNY